MSFEIFAKNCCLLFYIFGLRDVWSSSYESETFVQNLTETCGIMWNRQKLNGVVRSQTETSAVRFLAKSHKIVRNRVETSELVPYCI